MSRLPVIVLSAVGLQDADGEPLADFTSLDWFWGGAFLMLMVGTAAVAQTGPDPLPAESPFGGAIWSHLVPALLFAIAFGATVLLYRHFAGRDR
jgi:predicted acyltransferase